MREKRKRKIAEAEKRRKEERRRSKELKRQREEEEAMQLKIELEERKLLIAQRKLESIRLLDTLFDRVKVSPLPGCPCHVWDAPRVARWHDVPAPRRILCQTCIEHAEMPLPSSISAIF